MLYDYPFAPDLAVRLECKDCKNQQPNIVEDLHTGDCICGDCGLVLEARRVDTSVEWRTFADDDYSTNQSRVGDLYDVTAGATVDYGTFIDGDHGSSIAKSLQHTAIKTLSPEQRKRDSAFGRIQHWCDILDLPFTVSTSARRLWSSIQNQTKGANKEPIYAACIFVACQSNGAPRTYAEITNKMSIKEKSLNRWVKVLKKQSLSTSSSNTTNPEAILPRACTQLNLSQVIEMRCKTLIARYRELDLSGDHARSPLSIAGGVICFGSCLLGSSKAFTDVALAVGVTPRTVSDVYNVCFKRRTDLVPAEWIENGTASFARLPGHIIGQKSVSEPKPRRA
ncbi:hypothetical protein HETIRDRAFT_421573 [Heterobasidion irregulare TC 32-1]|uniref:General transcription factor TFIIB n=1 Tax=Heterobasidion irregulare (strain TC 32-1) TaxID=747525 RepID=W4JVD7_HETIT|nr:uncharacterized protein HETIRDRAFT_421573 [Heterobasidion irregulare TC 32-1]ETW77444.1 hypothetical protein HETIRDRAFT_421573 [Heterobasidion irregulare TC 32-1]